MLQGEELGADPVDRHVVNVGTAPVLPVAPVAVAAKRCASSENSAWFWLIGNSCPLHNAHPFGAKAKLMILISDRNGSAIRPS
jgi:hypothetical protein